MRCLIGIFIVLLHKFRSDAMFYCWYRTGLLREKKRPNSSKYVNNLVVSFHYEHTAVRFWPIASQTRSSADADNRLDALLESAPLPYCRSRQQSHQITLVRSEITVALPHFRYIYHIANIPAKDHAWQDFVPLSTKTLLNCAVYGHFGPCGRKTPVRWLHFR